MHAHEDPSNFVRCTGHSSRTGEPCKRPPNKGMTVCNSHGGRAPQTRAAATRNMEAGQLRAILERHGRNEPITDPLRALQELAGRVRAWFDFLEERIGSLRHSSQWDTEQIRGEVQLYVQAQDSFAKILVDMGKLKIDERLVAIHEATAAMVLDAMKAGFASAGVTGVAQAEAIKVTGRKLRVIQGGASSAVDGEKKASGY